MIEEQRPTTQALAGHPVRDPKYSQAEPSWPARVSSQLHGHARLLPTPQPLPGPRVHIHAEEGG